MRRLGAVYCTTVLAIAGATLLAACSSTSATGSVSTSQTAPARAPLGSVSSSVDTALAAAVDDWRGKRDTRKNVRAVVASVNGRIVLEEYYGTTGDVARDMESVTKSVTSTLIGAALARGDIASVDEPIARLLPAYASQMSPAVAAVTLRQLLTMTAGVPDWTDQNSPYTTEGSDWVAETLAAMTPTPEGEFIYSNGSAHLASAVLEEATGRSALDFAREVLFDPLGIDTTAAIEPVAVPSNFEAYRKAPFAWPVDPQQVSLGFSLLTLRPKDMLKIGELYLNGGEWQGRQMLPSDWVADATRAQVKTYDTWESYGYMWWVTTADREPAFAAVGRGGQLIEVVPSRGLVVAVASEYDALNPADSVEDPFDLTAMVNSVIAPVVAS